MKKYLSILLVLVCVLLTACGNQQNTSQESNLPESTPTESTPPESLENNTSDAEVSGYPFTLTIYDAEGKSYEETFESAPERVVTTTTSAAELLIALGLQDKIVGIITPDNAVPEEISGIFASFNDLGDKKTLSKEVIVAAEPDFVIGRVANFTEETSIDSYADLGILSYTQMNGNEKVSDQPDALIDDILNLGRIFGVDETAQSYADELKARLEAIRTEIAGADSDTALRTMFMVNFRDGTFGVMNGALQDNIVAMLGCEDVVEAGSNGLTYENLIAYNPDIIFYISADRNSATDATAIDTLLNEEAIATIPAIAGNRIMTIKYDEIMDVGPRLYDTIEAMYTFIYGD